MKAKCRKDEDRGNRNEQGNIDGPTSAPEQAGPGKDINEADEKISFADLPDDWECPICGAKKSEFEEIL